MIWRNGSVLATLYALGQIAHALCVLSISLLVRLAYGEAMHSPDDPEFNNVSELSLANEAHARGDHASAQACCQRILENQPNHAEALNLLGIIKCQLGDPQQGIIFIAKAAAADPDSPGILNNLGTAFSSLNRDKDAISSYKRVLELDPAHVTAHNNIATIYRNLGNLQTASDHYQRVLSLQPDHAEALSNYGNVLFDLGRLERAAEVLEKAISIKPDYEPAYNNLGIVQQRQGRYTDAQHTLEEALRLAPEFADAYTNLAEIHKETGRTATAVAFYQKSMALAPDRASVHSNYVYALNNLDLIAPEAVTQAHLQWNQIHLPGPVASNPRRSGRREKCRIGYVSPDFRQHSVSYFIEPILSNHDPEHFEVFCYSNGFIEDAVTERLRTSADYWRSIYGLTDRDADELIRADELDILVDLSGHTMGNRLPLFGRKPAPVQVSYLGYPATTGVAAMDYRLTDEWADPTSTTEHLHCENLVRIDGGFLSYRPPENAPEIGPLASDKNGFITFGSSNNLAKINASVLDAWAEILRSVENARLLLKGKALGDEGVRKQFEAAFADRGIGADRLDLRSWISGSSHLSIYNLIDIALDPFPYNGTTTLCETSWMGVPTLVLEGAWHSARVGVSLMSMIGHPELISPDIDTYVKNAVGLSQNPEKLHEYRRCLRAEMKSSRLCDGRSFTRALEAEYQKIRPG